MKNQKTTPLHECILLLWSTKMTKDKFKGPSVEHLVILKNKTATSSGYMWDRSTLSILSWLNAPLVSRRELNNMGIWYRMGNVPRAQDSTFTPTTNNVQNVNSSSNSVPLPAASMPKYVQPESGGQIIFMHQPKDSHCLHCYLKLTHCVSFSSLK